MINSFLKWIEERLPLNSLKQFLSKKTVPRHKHSFWYLFGGLSLFFFIIQVVTGMLLLVYYSPTPDTAYESVQFITTQVPFGWLIRSLHSWAANLMIASVFIHLFSTMLMKAYRRPREMMWFSGVVLFAIVLGFGFTGYLLPWDNTAYFATQIGTEIPRSIPLIGPFMFDILRGADFVSAESLTRLFALHVTILPLISFVLILFHIVLNQIHGSSTPIGTNVRMPAFSFYPTYLYRDTLAWSFATLVLFTLALMLPIQIGIKADPFVSAPIGIKPEWYFLPLFQTIRMVPPTIFGLSGEVLVNIGVFIIGAVTFLLPTLDRQSALGRPSPAFTVMTWAGIAYMLITIIFAYTT